MEADESRPTKRPTFRPTKSIVSALSHLKRLRIFAIRRSSPAPSRRLTVYLLNGGLLEYAQRMAAHESSRTTKPYDRRNDQVTLDQADCALTEPINGMLQNGGERGF
jgi:hypothetical protein